MHEYKNKGLFWVRHIKQLNLIAIEVTINAELSPLF
jgi:hypothetical protein